MVIGTLIAYIAQLLFQIPFLLKTGYKHNLKKNLKDENIKKILYLIIPVFLGSYVNQINAVVNRTLASTLEFGSITALNYANKLNIFAVGILVISISTVMYPILSKLASENNIVEGSGLQSTDVPNEENFFKNINEKITTETVLLIVYAVAIIELIQIIYLYVKLRSFKD